MTRADLASKELALEGAVACDFFLDLLVAPLGGLDVLELELLLMQD